MSFLLSASSNATAQTVKKVADEKKLEATSTFQMDARISLYTSEGPPTPGLFLRVTQSNKRGLVESITTVNPRTKAWSTDLLVGSWIPGLGKNRLLAAGYVAEAKGTNARIGAGFQIFRSGKWGLLAVPVLRWERQINGPPNHSFTTVLNPNVKLGKSRWSIAPDITMRKTQGRPWYWQVGAGIRYTFGKGKFQLEEGYLSNQAGVSYLRTRLISTFAH